MQSRLLLKPHPPDTEGCIQRVTPKSAGWEYVGFEVYLLRPGTVLRKNTDGRETCLVLVAGTANVETSEASFSDVGKRMSPFERTPPEAIYVPANDFFVVTAKTEVELAVCTAPGTGMYRARHIGAGEIIPARRGKGMNQRQVHTILADESMAESLLVVEVFTDEGHTSSYPSHKHDRDNPPEETYLEETYYHRFAPAQGWAMQRVYDDDRTLDECMAAYDRDVVLVPRGYHPIATLAGYDNYYLNVMAGPVKQWRFNWEPDHAWINSDSYPDRL